MPPDVHGKERRSAVENQERTKQKEKEKRKKEKKIEFLKNLKILPKFCKIFANFRRNLAKFAREKMIFL